VLRERKPLPRRKCSAKVIWEFNPDFQITLDSDPDVCSGFTTLSASVILPVVLKPSASNTISTVLHLHNTSATCELSVYLDGQRLRHECHPTYLGVTLDRTLSYREHLTKTAGKLKNRNNLLMKLASSTSANTLRSSALPLCYSAAEYCTPVWSCSAHTSQVDVQLNSTMQLISGTLSSTPLPWLPVLSNIEPPAYEGQLPLTSWWRKSSNMTVGQSNHISLTHHCYD